MTSAESAGALGLLTQQVMSQDHDLKAAESRRRLAEEELELMARELEVQAATSEHEHGILRIELTRAREESRGLKEVRDGHNARGRGLFMLSFGAQHGTLSSRIGRVAARH